MKRKLKSLLILALSAALALQGLPAIAQTKTLKMVFCGTVQPIDPLVTPYSQAVGTYIAERENASAEIVEKPAIDIDSESFINAAEEVLAEEADIIFLEWNVSRRYRGSDTAGKAEAAVAKLMSGSKTPAIYFIYTPQDNFRDNRAPFNKVAEHYNIPVIDGYSRFKTQYENGALKLTDFLTAGVKPAESGQALWSKLIINDLKGRKNLLSLPDSGAKAMTDITRYKAAEKSGEEEVSETGDVHILYVAKNGSDSGAGTKEEPLGSLEGARSRIRSLKAAQGADFTGATVYIRGGLYTISDSFSLTAEDSGSETAPITYCAYPGEEVRLTNAAKLDSSKFSLVTDRATLSRIPSIAWGRVYRFDLAAAGLEAGNFREKGAKYYSTSRETGLGNLLIANGKNGERAKYPNVGYSTVSAKHSGVSTQIAYDENKGDAWATADDAYIKGQMGQGYYIDTTRIDHVDTENKIIHMTYATPYTVKVGWPWSIVNLLEELDVPGEWYADRYTNTLYYYPKGEMKETEVLFSSNLNPVVKLEGTESITIEGMIIEGSCKDGVQILGGRNNKVKDCELRNLGRAGVYITATGQSGKTNNGVEGCHIHDTAIMGVYLYGGDNEGLTAQENYVVNCHFENYSSEMRSETGAVATDDTFGAIIKNNTIHNATAPAVFMGGTDDNITGNEFYNVCRFTDDYGVLYGDSNGAFRQGVQVTNNYFHDVIYTFPDGLYDGFLAGFYSDANRNNGANVSNNVFVRVRNPIFFANNHNMTARENLMLDSEKNSIVCSTVPSSDKVVEEKILEALEDGSFYTLTSEADASKMFGHVLVYRGYRTGIGMSEDMLKKYYLKYPWLETYLYNNPLQARYLKVNNNAAFGSAEKISLLEENDDTIDSSNNYISETPVAYDEGSTSDVRRIEKAMQTAQKETGDFTVWDVNTAGCDTDMLSIQDFSMTYPYQNADNVAVSTLTLCWEFASGADEYHVTVATDPDFKNIVFDEVTRENYAVPEGLQYGVKRYYWKVEATSLSEKLPETVMNLGGVHTFTSAKTEVTDPAELLELMQKIEEFIGTIEEGAEGGQYPEGTKAQLESTFATAKSVSESARSSQSDISEAVSNLTVARREALANRNLEEIDFTEIFSKKSETSVNFVKENKLKSAEETDVVTELAGGGLHYKGMNGSIYANEKVEAHQIVRFTGTFDFSGVSSGSVYSMFGLRAESMSRYMFDIPCYVFLVTKDNIELQGFKGTGKSGKFYMSVPNTFITEGKEHDIEFAALPAKNGNAVRIILSVDGVTVYDHIDENNIIAEAGYAGINFSQTGVGLTVAPAKKDTAYPSLCERLKSEAE